MGALWVPDPAPSGTKARCRRFRARFRHLRFVQVRVAMPVDLLLLLGLLIVDNALLMDVGTVRLHHAVKHVRGVDFHVPVLAVERASEDARGDSVKTSEESGVFSARLAGVMMGRP